MMPRMAGVRPRFGVMFSQAPPYETLAERWRHAESLGFDSIRVADHLTQFGTSIAFEAWSLLGALAVETRRVRIGALVSPVAFRHPVLTAMSAITIDHLSQGRLELGIGAGGGDQDAAALGHGPWSGGERLDRLAEQLTVLDALLRDGTVAQAGHHYPASATLERPVQRPRPPFVIAAQTPGALRLVARYGDTWSTLGGQPVWGSDRLTLDEAVAETARQAARLDEACAALGRDPTTIRRSLLAYKAAPLASVGAFEEYVGRYREVGIDEFVFSVASRGDPEVVSARRAMLERIASEVLPRLRDGA